MSRIPALVFFLFLFLPQAALSTPPTLTGKVLWVYDGDTIKVEHIGKVRLLGIDAPEHENSQRDNYYLKRGISRQQLRVTADDALQFLIINVKGQHVTLHTDREVKDRHDRLLAYVYLPDGRLVNRILLEKGLAAVYRKFNFRMKSDFLAAEEKARNNKLGFWQQN